MSCEKGVKKRRENMGTPMPETESVTLVLSSRKRGRERGHVNDYDIENVRMIKKDDG